MICCQLEDEVEKLLGDNRGLVQSDHALKLSRLMLRAETTEQRIMLLKILQVKIRNYEVFWEASCPIQKLTFVYMDTLKKAL